MAGAEGFAGVIGTIAGQAIGMVNEKRQYQNQLGLMSNQAKLNEQAATQDQKRAKDLWDYTNYENQLKHMKAAGLSPGLMYGMGGAGGQSTGAGKSQGASLAQDRSIEMSLKSQEMGLQLAALGSQIRLNESQAEKNYAEAEKTAGADTEVANKTIENLIALTENEKTKRNLIYAEIRLTEANEDLAQATNEQIGWSIKQMGRAMEKLSSEIKNINIDNDIKEATFENTVKASKLALEEAMSRIIKNKADARHLITTIAQKWTELGTQREQLILDSKKLDKQIEQWMREIGISEDQIDINQKGAFKDIAIGIGQSVVAGAILKGAKKMPTVKGFGGK